MKLPKPRLPQRPKAKSIYMALMIFLIGVMIFSGALALLTYMFMAVFGLLVNPIFRLWTMPVLLAFFVFTLSAGMGRSKLRPIDELMSAMHDVSKGDFTVRVDNESMPGYMNDLGSSFNDMAQELGGLEMFRKDFINNFSHEFKTPIVSIRGFAKQLEREDLTPEQRQEYLSIIVSESDRLANMANNVLLLTKLENQTIVTDKTVYRLDEQLRSGILLFERQWEDKNIDLDLELDEVDYCGNEEMVAHIWVNLINNAIKFSPENSVLSISLKKDENAALVRIADQGEGMDEATQKRIFEKFYQGDKAHATEGNGLGLSLVKRIVDLCGGTIRVESAPGKGAAFIVRLPIEE